MTNLESLIASCLVDANLEVMKYRLCREIEKFISDTVEKAVNELDSDDAIQAIYKLKRDILEK